MSACHSGGPGGEGLVDEVAPIPCIGMDIRIAVAPRHIIEVEDWLGILIAAACSRPSGLCTIVVGAW